MDVYHIWCNLKAGVKDTHFCDRAAAYFDHLKADDKIADYRITRRKLGLGPAFLPEFHLTIDVNGLAQLDEAFNHVASRMDPVEGFHHSVNSLVSDVFFALYRDFPDSVRQRGEERF
ncbi:MAG: DUF6614 family protein [Pseudomonadota bacterium]